MRLSPSILPACLAAASVATLSGCGGSGGETTTTGAEASAGPVVVVAKLTGAAAVPRVPGGTGTASITLSPRAGKACWKVSVSAVDRPLSAHVHEAPAGKLGPVVIPLGDRFSASGCVLAPKRALRAVADSPDDYYVDVHTSEHLQGAVRGQLSAGG